MEKNWGDTASVTLRKSGQKDIIQVKITFFQSCEKSYIFV